MEAVGRAVVVGVGRAAPLARVRAGTDRVVLVVVMAVAVGAAVMGPVVAAVGIGMRAPWVRASASSRI
jgi:hypothetical protein